MDNAEDRFKVIADLRKYGFIVEMDDFGSGYYFSKPVPVEEFEVQWFD